MRVWGIQKFEVCSDTADDKSLGVYCLFVPEIWLCRAKIAARSIQKRKLVRPPIASESVRPKIVKAIKLQLNAVFRAETTAGWLFSSFL